MDDLDRRLLDRIQRDFPIEPRPFKALAREFGVEEAEVIQRVRALHNAKLVRQIGPVFDLHKLGYTSTLCAAEVAPDAVDDVADHVKAYTEVTHNYIREANFNMWFTLVAPSTNQIEHILAEIRQLTGIQNLISLPAKKTFKINVHFPLNGDSHRLFEESTKINGDCPHLSDLSDRDIAVLRALQDPLPITESPYAEIARRAGVSEDEVIARIREWLDNGVIRRFGARVKHHAIGYTANGMSVWDVPADKADAAGQYMATLPEVSHCYTRPRAKNWPYNPYAMIHGKQQHEVLAVAEQIAAHLGIASYQVLFSTRELKKRAPVFFGT